MDYDRLTADPTETDAPFAQENSYTLQATVEEPMLAKAGSMVAFSGDLSFSGQSSAEGGITGYLKEAATNEGTPVMEVQGSGEVYLADGGKKVQVLDLSEDDSITVNGEDVLAFESSVDYSIGSIDSLAGSFAGGLTNVHLEGPGAVAITTHGDPIALEPPVATDPAATVAWGGTSPSVEVNASLTDMVGQQSGERYQMNFEGEGFVLVQPYEEHAGTQ